MLTRMTSEPPGWVPDPEPGSTLLRWWDGEEWTAWLTDEDDPPPPPDIPVPTVAPHRSRWLLRVVIAVAVVVVVIATLAAIGIRMADRERSAQLARAFPSALGVPSALPEPFHPVVWDPSTRLVRITRDASAVMPDWESRLVEPDSSPLSQAYVLSSYDDHTFVVVGVLLKDAIVAGDPQRTAGIASTTLVGLVYGDAAQATGPQTSATSVSGHDGGRAVQTVAWTQSATVSGVDEITTTVVEIQRDTWLVWITGMDRDASAARRAEADQAFASLWLR